ncbi:hypothetical protein PRIPAC_81215 [Pristionchus pacificus]|uniref:CX domain-containing protein n=1 Tax=Pristionchus pacificus TaxID=54126 RepID=A0A2A6CJR6_PRIPA|nr:hypothetical protein PRIPAC_81215 [Pristionchus pacificus]|eukprot:PDM78369.1 hypothetical protein PRIPAC_30948 [Pristionchus pacificus]
MIFKYLFLFTLLFSSLLASSTEPHGPTLEYKIAIGLLDATHHNGSSTRFVLHPELPIHVEENAYFWDARYLPSTVSNGCITFETGNKPGNKLASVFKHKIAFDSGETPSQLNWLCQPPKFCCELKCCDPSSPYYRMLTGSAFFLLFVPFCIAMYRMTAGDDVDKEHKQAKDRKASKRSVQESRA